jgi:hypothetical protein
MNRALVSALLCFIHVACEDRTVEPEAPPFHCDWPGDIPGERRPLGCATTCQAMRCFMQPHAWCSLVDRPPGEVCWASRPDCMLARHSVAIGYCVRKTTDDLITDGRGLRRLP